MNILRVGSITAGGNIIFVTTDSGATVYAVSGGKVVSGVAVGGVAKLKVKAGTWRVWAEKDGQQTSEVEVIVTDSYYKEMSFGMRLSSLAEGTLIRLNENGSGVNFYLSKHNYEAGLNGSGRELLVRKDCYDQRRWHSSNVNAYATSEIDSWLNGTYKGLLDSGVRELIGTTKFYYTLGNGDTTVSTLSRGVFLLSFTEIGKSASVYNTEGSELPIANTLGSFYFNGANCHMWVRSPNTGGTTAAGIISTSGTMTSSSASMTQVYDFSSGKQLPICSRPCFTLPANALVNPTPNADGSYTLMV